MTKTKEIQLPDGITQEMVDDAKQKYGEVMIVDLPYDETGDDVLQVLMHRPSRKDISMMEKYEDSDPKKAKDIIISATLLSHKDKVKNDDYLIVEANKAALELMPIKSADILALPGIDQQLPEGVTRENIEAAILQHREGNVKLVRIYLDDEGQKKVVVLMRRPGAHAISEYEKLQGKNPGKAKAELINGTLLTHRDMLADDWFFYGAFSAAAKMMPTAKATIKKL